MSVREALMRLRRVRLVDVTCGGVLVDRQLTSIDETQRKLLVLSGCSEDMASVGEGILTPELG